MNTCILEFQIHQYDVLQLTAGYSADFSISISIFAVTQTIGAHAVGTCSVRHAGARTHAHTITAGDVTVAEIRPLTPRRWHYEQGTCRVPCCV